MLPMTDENTEDMLETAMGLISAASDWRPTGIRWENGIPIALPPSNSSDSVNWRTAARRWLDTYQKHLSDLYNADVNDPAYNASAETSGG
jgi:hypothetical protein